MSPKTDSLGPNVAGTWYPADRRQLARQVAGLLEASPTTPVSEPPAALTGLIAPHAGFRYSGAVAAAVFRQLRGRRYRRVLLLGPSHYVAFQGGAVPSAGSYGTPLGETPIDVAAAGELANLAGMRVTNAPFEREHSLEAEIPFLQQTLDVGFSLLPVLVGAGSTPDSLQQIADALLPLTGPETLIVVSSDFTHFGTGFHYVPFEDQLPERIRRLDMGAIEPIVRGDRAGFVDYVERTGATICGRSAIDVLLRLLPPGTPSRLLAYDTSGNITGNWDHSVSYAGLVCGTKGGTLP